MAPGEHHYEGGQPKGFLQACLLLLIAESPGHGYDLMERLAAFGFERDPGSLYRMLRSMEREGLLRSEWELSGAGPGRRRYELASSGSERLRSWAEALMETHQVIEAYLERYRGLSVRNASPKEAVPERGRRTGVDW
ncbi:MAG TPA: helix-turn-helix transcriptional regulator [Candidatus Dormibacteraeota bacterium]|nr:helix-turn-helix transcriptional regulator [Candidatus Dormibacteraeota bacterium]